MALMKRESLAVLAVLISIGALVVSIISLCLSCEIQQHDRVVAFEQRRQEVRQDFHEGQILLEQISDTVSEGLSEETDPERKEIWTEMSHTVTGLQQRQEVGLREFEQAVAVGDTDARLLLEDLSTEAIMINRELETVLATIADVRNTR